MDDQQPRLRNSAVARNRLRTQIIGWAIIILVFVVAGAVLWNRLKAVGVWALLPLVVAIFIGWRAYKQVISARRR